MHSYIVQQRDVELLRQTSRVTYAKIELLNYDLQTVNVIEGQIMNDNFSCDGDSAVRRTYTCDVVVTDDTFKVGKDKNIWADRYIRVYYGIKLSRYDEIVYYLLGTFSFVDLSYSFSTTSKTLSLTCSDMMAEFNGTKRGVVIYDTESEAIFKIEAGQKYHEVLIGLCNQAGIEHYEISGVDNYEVPYDLEFSVGATYYEIWTKLNGLYNYWEFFFDEEGSFIWQKLPTGLGERLILDDAVIKPLIISESLSDSFQNIYNATEIWGRQLDITDDDRYVSDPDPVTKDAEGNNIFNITLYDSMGMIITSSTKFVKAADFPGDGHKLHLENTDEIDSLAIKVSFYKADEISESKDVILSHSESVDIELPNDITSVVVSDAENTSKGLACVSVGWLEDNTDKLINMDNFTNVAIKVNATKAKYININNLQNIPILNAEGSAYADESFTEGTIYVFRYRRTAAGDFKTSDSDPTFPNFYLLGQYQAHGYYEETDLNVPYSIPNLGYRAVQVIENTDLYCDEVCINQAQYETYKTTAKQDSITLNCIIIPFLEPNQKISYSPFMGEGEAEWIIKKLSWSTMSGTMTLEMYRFLEDYSYVYDKKENGG